MSRGRRDSPRGGGGRRGSRSQGGGQGRGARGLPDGLDQLEGRNIVLEALRRKKRKVVRIWLDERAKPDGKVKELVHKAGQQGVSLERVPRGDLDRRSVTGVHNGVIAHAELHEAYTVQSLLSELARRDELPFLALVDEVQYEHNLGAVLRSAMGAGVNGVIVPTSRGKGLTPVVQRVAMGGAEEVPLVREGLSAALAALRRAGVRIVGADMDGEELWDVDLRGAVAIVLGGEDKGLSPTLRKRCDAIAAIPLRSRLESLNVSVTAGLLFFEKVRQDRS